MKRNLLETCIGLILLVLSNLSHAGFPDDFSDVTWLDPNISSWPITAEVSVDVRGSTLAVTDSKRDVWPRRFHTDLGNDCCNRSLWIFAKYQGRWYAATFEYMRLSQINKNAEAVNGQQIKRPPFLESGFLWHPAEGEVYGFMTSGMARFNLDNVNVRERSNVALYRWGVGPTNNVDFEEAPRDSNGQPIVEGAERPEQCIERSPPAPIVNTHNYVGTATGTLTVTGANTQTADFNDEVSLIVSDDRTLTFAIDDESFSTRIAQNNSFSGAFRFDIGGVGICIVDITVNGQINGSRASGNAIGRDACQGNTAVFNATFTADSPTTPAYLDQRPEQAPRITCSSSFMEPILPLLLTE